MFVNKAALRSYEAARQVETRCRGRGEVRAADNGGPGEDAE